MLKRTVNEQQTVQWRGESNVMVVMSEKRVVVVVVLCGEVRYTV